MYIHKLYFPVPNIDVKTKAPEFLTYSIFYIYHLILDFVLRIKHFEKK